MAVDEDCSLCRSEATGCWWHRGEECDHCAMPYCAPHRPPRVGASPKPRIVYMTDGWSSAFHRTRKL